MKSLENHVVIVTGGAAGIGAAITKVLVQRGASVLAVDIDKDAGAAIAASNPDKIAFLLGDVADEAVAKNAVALATKTFGPPHRAREQRTRLTSKALDGADKGRLGALL